LCSYVLSSCQTSTFLKLYYHTFKNPYFSDVSVAPASRIRTADTSATLMADKLEAQRWDCLQRDDIHTKFQKCLDWFRGMAQVVHGHGTFSYKTANQTTNLSRRPTTTTDAYRDTMLGPLLQSVASTTACWWITDKVCIMAETRMLKWRSSEVGVRIQVWRAQVLTAIRQLSRQILR